MTNIKDQEDFSIHKWYNSTMAPVRCWSISTPVGRIWLVYGEKGLSLLTFSREAFISSVMEMDQEVVMDPRPFEEVVRLLESYFCGGRVDFKGIAIDPKGGAFDRQVWRILQEIPYGEVRTYRWVAERLGRPGAVRAVGQACRRNPLPIIIPCHRVVRASGEVGGYRGGVDLKRALLRIEADG